MKRAASIRASEPDNEEAGVVSANRLETRYSMQGRPTQISYTAMTVIQVPTLGASGLV